MKKNNNTNESNILFENSILLSLECWTKYVEGFTKGLQTSEKVNSASVLDCIGEVLEFMTSFKKQLLDLFTYCESILEENEKLKELLKEKEIARLEQKHD